MKMDSVSTPTPPLELDQRFCMRLNGKPLAFDFIGEYQELPTRRTGHRVIEMLDKGYKCNVKPGTHDYCSYIHRNCRACNKDPPSLDFTGFELDSDDTVYSVIHRGFRILGNAHMFLYVKEFKNKRVVLMFDLLGMHETPPLTILVVNSTSLKKIRAAIAKQKKTTTFRFIGLNGFVDRSVCDFRLTGIDVDLDISPSDLNKITKAKLVKRFEEFIQPIRVKMHEMYSTLYKKLLFVLFHLADNYDNLVWFHEQIEDTPTSFMDTPIQPVMGQNEKIEKESALRVMKVLNKMFPVPKERKKIETIKISKVNSGVKIVDKTSDHASRSQRDIPTTPKPEHEPEPEHEPKTEPKTNQKAKRKSRLKADPKPKPKTRLKSKSKTKPISKPMSTSASKPDPFPRPTIKPLPEPTIKSIPKSKPRSKTKHEPGSEQDSDLKLKPKPKPKSALESAPESELDSKPDSTSNDLLWDGTKEKGERMFLPAKREIPGATSKYVKELGKRVATFENLFMGDVLKTNLNCWRDDFAFDLRKKETSKGNPVVINVKSSSKATKADRQIPGFMYVDNTLFEYRTKHSESKYNLEKKCSMPTLLGKRNFQAIIRERELVSKNTGIEDFIAELNDHCSKSRMKSTDYVYSAQILMFFFSIKTFSSINYRFLDEMNFNGIKFYLKHNPQPGGVYYLLSGSSRYRLLNIHRSDPKDLFACFEKERNDLLEIYEKLSTLQTKLESKRLQFEMIVNMTCFKSNITLAVTNPTKKYADAALLELFNLNHSLNLRQAEFEKLLKVLYKFIFMHPCTILKDMSYCQSWMKNMQKQYGTMFSFDRVNEAAVRARHMIQITINECKGKIFF